MTQEQLALVSPAPWYVDQPRFIVTDDHGMDHDNGPCDCWVVYDGNQQVVAEFSEGDKAVAEFIALARNAFDVMMRRSWTATKWMPHDEKHGQWIALTEWDDEVDGRTGPDPFTALVEADAWMKEMGL